jgi:hypothetical protein
VTDSVARPVRHLYRIVHLDNLATLLLRGGLHAPNTTPEDGHPYRTIHSVQVQEGRRLRAIGCGPGGTIHDYVPFYFGPLSVMLLNLHSGRVEGYHEGQRPIVYVVSTIERVSQAGRPWVFSDGHGLAAVTRWFDDPARLTEVDWDLVGARYWADTPEDNDRKRRKQAEFLVHAFLPWTAVAGIAVFDEAVAESVRAVLARNPVAAATRVVVKREWYY